MTFELTNSGAGLNFHPSTNEKGIYYRTLSFTGVSLGKLRQSSFLEQLLSFRRTRPPENELKGIVSFPSRLPNISELYRLFLHGWPGNGPFMATNPGSAQRGSSCSLQATVKWLKKVYDPKRHPFFNLWIKLAAFRDYLDHEKTLSSQFISDAIRKIATHIDKMDHKEKIPSQLFAVWQEIHELALDKQRFASSGEKARHIESALSAKKTLFGWEEFEPANFSKYESQSEESIGFYDYPHVFPHQSPPLQELANLHRPHIASLDDEMTFRLNFLRSLPDFTEWKNDKSLDGEKIGELLQLFFYTKKRSSQSISSYHIPDGFLADFLNAWIGIYLKAESIEEQRERISPKVFLEWLNGAKLLIDFYTPEMRFESSYARKRWQLCCKFIENKQQEIQDLLGEGYEPPPNYWTVWDRDFETERSFFWLPFGIHFHFVEEGERNAPYAKKLKNLPAMAFFARNVLADYLEVEERDPDKRWEDMTDVEKLPYFAKQIEGCDGLSRRGWSKKDIEIQKCILSFGVPLVVIPYYEVLRKSLGTLFVLADRHLSESFWYDRPALVSPNAEHFTRSYLGERCYPCIETSAGETTRLFHPEKKPESVLPKVEKALLPFQDLNERIKQVLLQEKRELPFMTEEEEKEFLAFVEKAPITRLPELLVFFEKCLHKLYIASYQTLFEHLLFRIDPIEPGPLLFSFFERGYEKLLKGHPKIQAGAAALLHSHLLAYALAPRRDLFTDSLFEVMERLVDQGKKNPILGRALGQAVFAAVPALEFFYPSLDMDRFLPILAKLSILTCIPADYTEEPYSSLEINYGWMSFKALLKEHPGDWLKKAASEVFGEEEVAYCIWDPTKDQLDLKTRSLFLKGRVIDGPEEYKMRPIPKEDRNFYKFRSHFGDKQNFFAHLRVEGNEKIYAFTWKRKSYELRVGPSQITIHKKFGERFYQLLDKNSAHFRDHHHLNWKAGEEWIIEDSLSEKIVAKGILPALHRVERGVSYPETLVNFNETESFLRILFNRLLVSYRVWATDSIQRIELPTLGLAFVRQQNTLYSMQFPGFFIAEEQSASFLKQFTSILVLENSCKKKKIIAPIWPFGKTPQPYQEKPTSATILASGGEETNQHPYLIFDLDAGQKDPILPPRPRYQTETIWLIALYLHTKEYASALALLKESQVLSQRHLLPLSKKIVECLDGNDAHPHAIALRLRLQIWMGKSKMKEWDNYCQKRHSMGRFALSPEEEKKVQKLVKRSRANLFFGIAPPFSLKHSFCQTSFKVAPALSAKILEGKIRPRQSITAPGEEFILNFLYYCDVLRSDKNEEKEKLKPLFFAACGDDSSIISNLGRILWRISEGKDSTDYRKVLEEDSPISLPKMEVAYPGSSKWAIPFKSQNIPQRIRNEPRDAVYPASFEKLTVSLQAKEQLGEVSLSDLEAHEVRILALANNFHGDVRLQLERARDLRPVFDIETLLIALGRKDLSMIRLANPSLSSDEIDQLMQEVFEYAQKKRVLTHPNAPYHYVPEKEPEILIAEVLSGFALRKEQIEALKKLVTTPGLLFEARTGFGKSKVLLPLWLLLCASEKLAIFISPATLFDGQEKYLQTVFKKGYRFFAKTIEFSRSSPSSPEDIYFIIDQLRHAENMRIPVFMSDQTAHNLFVLKMKETAYNKGTIEHFLALRRVVKERGSAFIDEPHKVLNDQQEFNYSLGSPEAVTPKRIEFAHQLYLHLFDLLFDRYHVECWPNEKLPVLTGEVYQQQIIAPLMERMMKDPSKEERLYLLQQMDAREQGEFEQHLEGERGEYIRLLHDQLHYYLPQTLQRHAGEHYAFASFEGERIAIPLEDARHPRKQNEFVSLDQTLNFTIQANMKIPFSMSYFFAFLQKLSEEVVEEAEKENKLLNETKGYRHFVRLTKEMNPSPSGLLSLTPQEIERIYEHLHQNVRARLEFIKLEILPHVRQFPKKVTSNPHLLVHSFKEVVGASGTLSMEHFPYIFEPLKNAEAMGNTLQVLVQRNDPIIELPMQAPMEEIHKKLPEISVILEVGASFRHYLDLEEIAQEILKSYSGYEGVATFDEEGHPIVMMKNSPLWMPKEDLALDIAKIFWFFGQKDTTGRDETLDPKAIGAVFVNQYTTLTHFIQGVGRMRGLLASQQVRIAMDKEASFAIRLSLGKEESEPFTIQELMDYFREEEDRKGKLANFRSLNIQLDALLENAYWDAALAGKAASIDQGFLVQSTEDPILQRPGLFKGETPVEEALRAVSLSFKKKAQKLSSLEGLPCLEETRRKVTEKMHYPEAIPMHHQGREVQIVETTAEQQVVVAAAREVEQETETISVEQTETISSSFSWTQFLQSKESLPRTQEIIPHPLNRYNKKQATSLCISENALCTFTGDTLETPEFLQGYQKPLHYIAGLLNHPSPILIDTQEAEDLLKHPEKAKYLWLIGQGPLLGKTFPDNIRELEEEALHIPVLNKKL